MGWRVRPVLAADVPRLAEVRVRSWQHAYAGILPSAALDTLRAKDFESRFAGYADAGAPTKVFVGTDADDDVPMAYCVVGAVRDEADRHPELPTGELFSLYALPDVIGTGVGHALHEAGLDHLAKHGFAHVVLWVFETNDIALRFYRAHGWAPDGSREQFDFGGASVPEVRYYRSV